MYLSITKVKPLKDHKLLLTFENKEKRIFDVTPYLSVGIFNELCDPTMFNTVRINFGSIRISQITQLQPNMVLIGRNKGIAGKTLWR